MSASRRLKDTHAFMRGSEGRAWLEGIKTHLRGRTIQRVTFAATDDGIATTFHLDNNETYRVMDEELLLDTLYDQFSAFFWQLDNKP
ncbi:MAG: hypothetical protein AMXMBFR84_48380 [Candidatus Hydrogenedentota bacterium]